MSETPSLSHKGTVYLVGGAVRDQLLNIATQDRDWVVVGTSPEDMLENGFQQVGRDFPVFLHPKTKEEYALARKEQKTGHGYQDFEFDIDASVTLEEDLERRDLTINAMAQDLDGMIHDPYQGQLDLQHKILRHVSPSFIEDPLRVLRVTRFHARYAHLGFTIAQETLELMAQLCQQGELHHLTPERVWLETQKALGEHNPEVYFTSLHQVGALQILFPEIAVLDGTPQSPRYHPEIDTFIHVMQCVAAAAYLTDDIGIRFAVLLHDVGKGLTPKALLPKHKDHETTGVPVVKAICERLKVSKSIQNLAVKVCSEHLYYHTCFEMNAAELLGLFKRLDCFRQPALFQQWLIACEADQKGRGATHEDWQARLDIELPNNVFLQRLFEAASSITFQMLPKGITGADIGIAFDEHRLAAIEQAIPA